MNLTSSTSILSLLKSGMVIHMLQVDNAPYICRSTSGKPAIIAHRPKYGQRRVFYWSERGLTAALQWAADGWHQVDDPTPESLEQPRPQW